VSIHGLRRALLTEQTDALGVPSRVILLPETVTNAVYEERLGTAIKTLASEGYTHAAFGDIFLEDLRVYREAQLAAYGMQAVFPLWKEDTSKLAYQFLKQRFKAIVVSTDAAKLGASFAGSLYDEDFLRELPAGVDPCGENGEFHTFCFDGPVFDQPVQFEKGEVVYREYPLGNGQFSGFWYCDLLPSQ
jgi:uncharacterized protein (TIGR00290 family)